MNIRKLFNITILLTFLDGKAPKFLALLHHKLKRDSDLFDSVLQKTACSYGKRILKGMELIASEIKKLNLFSNSLLDANNKTKSLLSNCGIEVKLPMAIENCIKEMEVTFAK